MPTTFTNSKYIVANSVSLIDANNINNILDIISGIVGDAPTTLNTLGKLANAINKKTQLYNALVAMINTKFPTSGIVNCYTKQEVQQMFLNFIDNAPDTLDTLNELAKALAYDANYASAI